MLTGAALESDLDRPAKFVCAEKPASICADMAGATVISGETERPNNEHRSGPKRPRTAPQGTSLAATPFAAAARDCAHANMVVQVAVNCNEGGGSTARRW